MTIRQKELEGLAPRTVASYRSLAEGPIHKAFGEIPWREVTRGMIISFQEAALQAGKTTTGNRAVAILSIAFGYAIYKEWTETNPCSRVKRNPPTSDLASAEHADRAAKFRTMYLPKEEFLAVYGQLPEWHQDVLLCAYTIGVRQADLLHLRRDAVKNGCIYIKERKTARGTRKAVKIIMNDDVASHIERAVQRQKDIAARSLEVTRPRSGKVARRRQYWPESVYVFCNEQNKPITQSALRTAIRRAGGSFDFRDIRATVVTDDEAAKAEAGISLGENILGHTKEMLAVYQKHVVQRADGAGRGELPTALGVNPKLRVIQLRKI